MARGGRSGATDPLAAAMQVLGRQLAVLTGALSHRQAELAFGRGPAAGLSASVTGLFGGLLGTLTAKITAAVAPIAVLAAAVGSPTSGFGVFLSAVKLLGGTLGSLLLPGFLVLSAAVYAVSGYVADSLLPVLKQWYQAVVDGAIKGVQLLEAAVVYTARKLSEFADWLKDFNDKARGRVNRESQRLGGPDDDRNVFDRVWRRFIQGWSSTLQRREPVPGSPGAPPESEFGRILRDIRERDKAGGRPAGGFQLGGMFGGMTVGETRPGGFLGRFLDGLRKSIQEFRFQNAPRASVTTGADLYREAQLAATNVSPFEKTAQEFMGKVLNVLGSIDTKTQPAMVD